MEFFLRELEAFAKSAITTPHYTFHLAYNPIIFDMQFTLSHTNRAYTFWVYASCVVEFLSVQNIYSGYHIRPFIVLVAYIWKRKFVKNIRFMYQYIKFYEYCFSNIILWTLKDLRWTNPEPTVTSWERGEIDGWKVTSCRPTTERFYIHRECSWENNWQHALTATDSIFGEKILLGMQRTM